MVRPRLPFWIEGMRAISWPETTGLCCFITSLVVVLSVRVGCPMRCCAVCRLGLMRRSDAMMPRTDAEVALPRCIIFYMYVPGLRVDLTVQH